MNAKKIITAPVLITVIGWATAFSPSEALAEWSDGGPEMYPLTYPAKELVVEGKSKVASKAVDRVKSFETVALWSDGGPERFRLTYPAETVAKHIDSRVAAKECELDRSVEAVALWSDGGPERFPLTYPAEIAETDSEICLAKKF